MATLYVSYYGAVNNRVSGQPQFVDVLTTSTTSTQGTANTNKGAIVASLFSDTAHYYTVGADPTAAVTSGAYLPANTLVWVALDGLGSKVAARTLT